MSSTNSFQRYVALDPVSEKSINPVVTEMEGPDTISFGDPKGISWRALFTFMLRKHVAVLVLALTFSIMSALSFPFTAILFGEIFQEFTKLGNGSSTRGELLGNVAPYILMLLGVACFSWILNWLFFSSWLWFGTLQARNAREQLFENSLRKRRNCVEESGECGLSPRYQTQIGELQTATSQPLGFIIQDLAVAFISFGVALVYCWSLTFVIIAGLPVAFAILNAISRFVSPHVQLQEKHVSVASRLLKQAITAIETVKIFNGQEHERKQYSSALNKAAKGADGQAKWNAAQISLIRFVTLSMFVQGFWYGSRLVRSSSDGTTVGNVMTTFWACLMAAQSIESILPQLMFLEKGKAAAASLRSTLSSGDLEMGEGEFTSGCLKPAECRGEISMTGVKFTYPASDKVRGLENLTLCIAAGETVFITGHSGSGKSTIGNLLLRLWERDSGSITIDDINIEELDVEWLRRNVMLVQQQSPLFNESISLNISFGSPEYEMVTQKALEDSYKNSHLQDILSELPDSFNTIVGLGANELSGGQRQRIGIARARVRDSPILILDESTSALDETLKDSVMDEIRQWRQGKTTIIITHDLTQINSSDFVYVLDGGHVVQSGIRRELEKDYMGQFQKLHRASMVVDNEEYMISPVECSPPPMVFDFDNSQTPNRVSPDELQALKATYALENPQAIAYEAPEKYDYNNLYAMGSDRWDTWQKMQTDHALQNGDFQDEHFIYPTQGNYPQYDKKADINVECESVGDEDDISIISDLTDDEPMLLPKEQEQLYSNQEVVQSITLLRAFTSLFEVLDIKEHFLLAIAFFAAFFNALSTPLFSFCIAKVLLTFFYTHDSDAETSKWSLIVLMIAVLDAASIFIMQYLLEYTGQTWIDRLRMRAFTNILQQDRQWFDKEENKVSHISTDLDSHTEEMRNLLARFAGYAFIGVVMMVISVSWSLIQCWKLTVVGLCAAPVLYFIAKLFATVSSRYEVKYKEEEMALNAIFHETVSNLQTVRALLLERHFKQKFASASGRASKTGFKKSVVSGLAFGIADSAILFATALVFYYGSYLVSSGISSVESVVSVFSLLLFCLANANVIVGMIPQVAGSKESSGRVLRLSSLRVTEESSKEVKLDGSIHLENVSFTYPGSPDVPVLSEVSLSVQAGEVVALVGPSGSGKSTIASLLQRLYTEMSGSIYFNNNYTPADEICTSSLRSQISFVPQTPKLFSATIRENITYGIPPNIKPSQEQIEDATKKAGIHDWISSLPNGYNTVLRNGEGSVSVGQAARIAIARAMVRKPRVLVLDEPTASLDGESARGVYDAILGMKIRKGWQGRMSDGDKTTVIVITHRPELMAVADRVVRMEKGRVVDDGTTGFMGNGRRNYYF